MSTCAAPDDPPIEQQLDLLRGWLSDAEVEADTLKGHLRRVLEIARTWQPDYATVMDRKTLALAAEAIGE